MPQSYALGLDFGTGSVRALLADTADGREIASAEITYPSGRTGVLTSTSDPNVARQHPGDYLPSAVAAVRAAMSLARDGAAGTFEPASIVGIGVSATASTPLAVDAHNTPLGTLPEFADELDAQAWLWKDHTAHEEAAQITRLAHESGLPHIHACGGVYSSEWYWAKLARLLRVNPRVAQRAAAWIELSDYIPAALTDVRDPTRVARNICAAGHKALFHAAAGGLPSEAFLERVQPGLGRWRMSFRTPTVAIDQSVGGLCAALAQAMGLREGLPVAAGAIDAHLGALGAGCRPGTLVRILGTSACDCAVLPLDERQALQIPGVCGVVPGSIVPGVVGVEAGQPAVGDIFDWFVRRFVAGATGAEDAYAALTTAAAAMPPGASGLLALDWHNGNRSVLCDPLLTGLIVGETLATTPAEVFRALIEATGFGARRILEQLVAHGVSVERVVLCGGVAEKNGLLRQVHADILQRPMLLSSAVHTCALGAAIAGAVVGGAHATVLDAQRAMTGVKPVQAQPQAAHRDVYEQLYRLYLRLHDAFGGVGESGSLRGVMKELIEIRNQSRWVARSA